VRVRVRGLDPVDVAADQLSDHPRDNLGVADL
jgi:hypothetical protein